MVNRKVREALLSSLGVSPQALSQRAKKLKEKYGPMTTDEAVYVIAHGEGIDLSRHLPLEQLDRVRSLIPRELPSVPRPPKGKEKSTARVRNVTKYPLVHTSTIKRAATIGMSTFPKLVALENSIRALITDVLSKAVTNWWQLLVPKAVQQRVQRTIDKEKKFPYREKRGTEPLTYCNFIDLKEIIANNRKQFEPIIVDFGWFEARMTEVYMARNNLAHSVLPLADDVSRIELFYRDWARLLETAGYTGS